MEDFLQIIQNKYIYVPFFLWLSIQTFKVIYDLITTKKFNFKRIVGAGGMPSSHSATVVVLATLIGRNEGYDSSIFALSVIFALIVMYDAAGVRRAAGKQAKILNKITQTPGMKKLEIHEKLVELIGHTPKQVFVGAALGLIVGLVV